MTLPEFYDSCREVNRVLGVIAFCWLAYRTTRAWPAEWAKPHYVWHYRSLLCVTSGFTLAVSWSAWQYEWSGSSAGPVSTLYTVLCLAVLVLCYAWPRPAAWRHPEGASR